VNRKDAQDAIRDLAKNRDKVRFTKHSRERDPDAGKPPISDRQAVQCLLNGFLTGDPTPDISLANGWKFTCERIADETVTVVAGVVVPATKILVITGYENRPFTRRPKPSSGMDREDEWKDEDEQ
jgi:hypothetical protein